MKKGAITISTIVATGIGVIASAFAIVNTLLSPIKEQVSIVKADNATEHSRLEAQDQKSEEQITTLRMGIQEVQINQKNMMENLGMKYIKVTTSTKK